MRLTDDDLKQIDQEYLSTLSPEQLRHISGKLLEDLRDARDRLNANPANSSRPSGSYAPWEQASFAEAEKAKVDAEAPPEEFGGTDKGSKGKADEAPMPPESKRKPGKQPGSKGFGRQVEMQVTGEEVHKASECAGCGAHFAEESPFTPTAGHYVLDIEKTECGLQVTYVKHLYGEQSCDCGHVTQTKPGRCAAEEGWKVPLTECHLVGPMLSSLIICLSLRMRLSRMRIQEFLQDWLGITLSTGCINQCITEGGRASAPLEEALIAEIQQSELLYADETGWKESGQTAWLWVLRTATVTLYIIGRRSWDVIADIMEYFAGWLMTDGYGQYRKYGKRLRCLAHIIRKARGLAESCHPEAAEFGEKVLETLTLFITGVYAARGDPDLDLLEKFSQELAHLKELCEQHRDHQHDKTSKLARELLNDWDAIWSVLAHPELPITNNVAERALRHWVIARKISFGTRNPQGSRAFTLLASVIDTCRQRGLSPWPYIADVIAARRKGEPPPPIPHTVS
ncbi:MAG: IS66 family transposase [Gammaproteobacteria bacterium]|nr:IS66 family transposase [Gammaproteobacteria bacterium]